MRKTNAALIVDVSGSMRSIEKPLTDAVNKMLEIIKKEGENSYISVTTFGSRVSNLHPLIEAKAVNEFSRFKCNEPSTALFDGIAIGSEEIDTNNPDESYLVLVFTDGGENSSRKYNASSIKKFISDREKKDNWTFTIQLPSGQKESFIRQFEIPSGNLREWDATEDGVTELASVTTSSLQNYYGAIKGGARSVKGFYNVTTDLSQVAPTDLKATLVDQKTSFKVLKVDKEADIKPFVELKTGVPYKKGTAFYELTKKEVIQRNKEIAIMEKGKSSIYTGNQARSIIGLPTDGVTNCKVTPGNHAGYSIFVKSNSVNRKLVRGTALLVRI